MPCCVHRFQGLKGSGGEESEPRSSTSSNWRICTSRKSVRSIAREEMAVAVLSHPPGAGHMALESTPGALRFT